MFFIFGKAIIFEIKPKAIKQMEVIKNKDTKSQAIKTKFIKLFAIYNKVIYSMATIISKFVSSLNIKIHVNLSYFSNTKHKLILCH